LPVGVLGDDEPGKLLLRAFRHKRIPVSGVFKDKSYTTVTKTASSLDSRTAGQQVVRLDREPQKGPIHTCAARSYSPPASMPAPPMPCLFPITDTAPQPRPCSI